ncbi:hypothetical protein OUZ56_027289 [Daphnia magna]|uniref:Uncharacterized protein n=1 Tax=Daphnia magna TaxID=35525 RepID=A0ABQ9ZPC5_9CRUS|nr:hypothetical protein OUZ56_027289 [Daphnia magna]
MKNYACTLTPYEHEGGMVKDYDGGTRWLATGNSDCRENVSHQVNQDGKEKKQTNRLTPNDHEKRQALFQQLKDILHCQIRYLKRLKHSFNKVAGAMGTSAAGFTTEHRIKIIFRNDKQSQVTKCWLCERNRGKGKDEESLPLQFCQPVYIVCNSGLQFSLTASGGIMIKMKRK